MRTDFGVVIGIYVGVSFRGCGLPVRMRIILGAMDFPFILFNIHAI